MLLTKHVLLSFVVIDDFLIFVLSGNRMIVFLSSHLCGGAIIIGVIV